MINLCSLLIYFPPFGTKIEIFINERLWFSDTAAFMIHPVFAFHNQPHYPAQRYSFVVVYLQSTHNDARNVIKYAAEITMSRYTGEIKT